MPERASEDGRSRVAAGIGQLVGWAVTTELADIPPPVLQRAVRVLADDLGAMIGARDEPEVAEFHRQVLRRPRPAEATVFRGGRERTDRVGAAVANAAPAFGPSSSLASGSPRRPWLGSRHQGCLLL